MRLPARTIDPKGRCCGRKPLSYKRPLHLFCPRCDGSFDPATGEQLPNCAWKADGDGFVATYPDSTAVQFATDHIRRAGLMNNAPGNMRSMIVTDECIEAVAKELDSMADFGGTRNLHGEAIAIINTALAFMKLPTEEQIAEAIFREDAEDRICERPPFSGCVDKEKWLCMARAVLALIRVENRGDADE